ncbi:DUF421 domain-containing protein [Kineosporia mesophila]|uniref:DUF421 domain-containing protein n=1 Tax=Kineosporia mesophila TaxID=566012 RepID=A0ABP6Z1M6_9ACTN|nr:YetF domain-containing protein [Kineosporia mesophila]MCD5351124.1 DUF421 domain-containing protein [Kineosporia mesophila]
MEIVVRAAVIWVFLWVITRAVGRSTLGELSTFQLILFVTMGDMVQQGVTQQDYSVTGALLAVSTFAVITVGVSYANQRWRRLLPITHGVPIIIVRDGEPDMKALNGERMSVNDLFASAREQGIRRIRDVELAVLEANGRISFFTHDVQDGAPDPPEAG